MASPWRRFSLAWAGALVLSATIACTPARAADPGPGLPAPRWRAWQTGMLRPDRLQHASLSFSAGLAGGLAARSAAAALASGGALGLGKELFDMRTTHFDWGDLAADAAGTALAVLVTASLER